MNGNAQIDVLSARGSNFAADGSVAQRMLSSGFNLQGLRTNDVLRKDEWKLYDTKVIEVARQQLTATTELLARGLSMNIPNPLGTTQIEWETVSDMNPAEVTMSGLPESERDRIVFALQSQPLPIIHKEFQINLRTLEASRKTGQPLDTTQAALASRLVSEKIESILFAGTTAATTLGGNIYGLTNHTNRNTGTTAANWDSAATGANYLADLLAAIDKLQTDHQYGPYGVFVTYAAYNRMMDDFKAASDKSIISRLLEIPQIQFIKPNRNLTAGHFVMFQLSAETIEILNGFSPTTVMWDTHAGFVVNFKVMAIMVPRIRPTQTGQLGIAHYSPSG